jgi:hypothetical protein
MEYALWLAPAVVILLLAVAYFLWRSPPAPEPPAKRPVFDRPIDAQAGLEPVSLSSLGQAMDDNQAHTTGTWVSQQAPGSRYVGRYFKVAQSGQATAVFEVPNHLTDGTYDVLISYVPAPDRATNVRVQVVAAKGAVIHKTVNQRQPPPIDGLFHSLGTFSFQGQAEERIEISAEGADGSVAIDAVRFVRAIDGLAKVPTERGKTSEGTGAEAKGIGDAHPLPKHGAKPPATEANSEAKGARPKTGAAVNSKRAKPMPKPTIVESKGSPAASTAKKKDAGTGKPPLKPAAKGAADKLPE